MASKPAYNHHARRAAGRRQGTTTAAKRQLRAGQNRPTVAADVYRPAAITAAGTGTDLDIPVYIRRMEQDPLLFPQHSFPYALSHLKDVVIMTRPGVSMSMKRSWMNWSISRQVKPHEILLVVDAMTGQDAVTAASAFDRRWALMASS